MFAAVKNLNMVFCFYLKKKEKRKKVGRWSRVKKHLGILKELDIYHCWLRFDDLCVLGTSMN